MMQKKPLGLYIHWPFCLSKCPYCDFNSHVRHKFAEDEWQTSILQEINRNLGLINPSLYELKSIFFGGGTPSLMNPTTVEKIINHALTKLAFSPTLEITLEANPNSVETAKFANLNAAGINRISLGIQAFNDEDLQKLGRKHSAQEAIHAIKIAQKHFCRVSFDLIYARSPEQSIQAWRSELQYALSFDTEHLSLYQLMIEPNTIFAKAFQKGNLQVMDDDKACELYLLTENTMQQFNYNSYEVSNYAKAGAECLHNLLYWHYEDYIGVGPGAHGRITVSSEKIATCQIKKPELWLNKVNNLGNGDEIYEPLNQAQQLQERLLMGLRLAEGMPLNYFNLEKVSKLQQEGLVNICNNKIILTVNGRLKINSILKYLI